MWKGRGRSAINDFMLDLNFFIGSWRFKREISNPEVAMIGHAVFDQDGHMSESANYHLCDFKQECYQSYFYEFDQNSFYILKSNKQILHVFDMHDFPNFHHTHGCGKDYYSCDFKITSDASFEIFYIVKGPKKDYTSKTLYFK